MTAYRKLFKRSVADHPLTPKKLRCLRFVAECRVLTVPQIADLTGMSEKAVGLHMCDLYHLGYVERTGVPRAALADEGDEELLWGRAPTIYTLTRDGADTLIERGYCRREEVSDIPQYGPRNALFLAHELQVRDVRVWLERCRRNAGHEGITSWRDGTAAHVGACRPDALFTYKMPAGTLVGLVEVDRGTERSPSRWREKVQQYEAAHAAQAVEWLTKRRRWRVLVIAPDRRRVEAIAAIVAEPSSLPAETFWLAERAVLEGNEIEAPVWRVGGRESLSPLIGG